MNEQSAISKEDSLFSMEELEQFVDRRNHKHLEQSQAEQTIENPTFDTDQRTVSRNWQYAIFWSIIVICMGIMSLMALYHIHIGSRVTELNRYYAKQLKQQKQLKHTHKELQYALARLRDPKRLKQVARQELGMQQTEASQILPIDQINNLLNRSASASHTHLAKSNKSHKNDTKK